MIPSSDGESGLSPAFRQRKQARSWPTTACQVLVGEGRRGAAVHDHVSFPRDLGWDAGAHDDLAFADPLLVQLAEQIELVGTGERVRGQECDDERLGMNGGHGTVAQPKIRLGECRDPARVHLEHLERGLARRSEPAAAGEIDRGAEGLRGHLGQRVGAQRQHVRGGARGLRGPRPIGVGLRRHRQEAARQDEVREAAGHDEAAVVGLLVEHHDADPRRAAVGGGQVTLPVARDDQVARERPGLQQQVHHRTALGAVAGAREGDHQERTRRRQAAVRMDEQQTSRQRQRWSAQALLERQVQALAHEERAARAREDDGAAAVRDPRAQRFLDRGSLPGNSPCGLDPGDGLLADLAEGMGVPLAGLLRSVPIEQGADRSAALQGRQPVFDQSARRLRPKEPLK